MAFLSTLLESQIRLKAMDLLALMSLACTRRALTVKKVWGIQFETPAKLIQAAWDKACESRQRYAQMSNRQAVLLRVIGVSL